MAHFHGSFRSHILGMDTGLDVALPYDRPADNMKTPCPVVYLLHGLGQNSSAFIRNCGVERYARKYGIALVMPEVGRSFYTNLAYGKNYFDYITFELPEIVSQMFNVSDKSEDTYIAGLSMGGYGAFKCGFTYPEKYKAIGSFSGLMDIEFLLSHESEEQMREIKGMLGETLQLTPEMDIYHLASKFSANDKIPNIYFTCGTEDEILFSSRNMRDFLLKASIEHTYEEWQGDHDWTFWQTSLEKFLARHFESNC